MHLYFVIYIYIYIYSDQKTIFKVSFEIVVVDLMSHCWMLIKLKFFIISVVN